MGRTDKILEWARKPGGNTGVMNTSETLHRGCHKLRAPGPRSFELSLFRSALINPGHVPLPWTFCWLPSSTIPTSDVLIS